MADAKRVIVTGATGLIGRSLCAELCRRGYAVVVFSRDPAGARRTLPGMADYVAWKVEERGPWSTALDGAHAVIHLAGVNNFARRWDSAFKQEIMESRVVSTRGLVNAMEAAANRPRTFVCSSAIGYYGPRDDTPLDEQAPAGSDFQAEVVKAWEAEACRAEALGIRVVNVRTGVVFGSDRKSGPIPISLSGASLSRPGVVLDFEAGVLPLMAFPFRLFVGGPIGSGKQWFSWVHLDDVVGLFVLALEDERVRGPINATAPDPRINRDFSAALGAVLGRPSWFPLPRFALQLLVGEVAEVLVQGQRVLPKKAQELGYRFKYPQLEPALRQVLGR